MKTIYATRINSNFPVIDEESIPAFMEITLVGDEMRNEKGKHICAPFSETLRRCNVPHYRQRCH